MFSVVKEKLNETRRKCGEVKPRTVMQGSGLAAYAGQVTKAARATGVHDGGHLPLLTLKIIEQQARMVVATSSCLVLHL